MQTGNSANGFIAQPPTPSLPKFPKPLEEYPPGVVISPRTGRPKRRKAARACIHCQRTHLTCDNNRPCERCVGRGLADTCRDGVRKKAKYLADVPDAVAMSEDSLQFDPRYKEKKSKAKGKKAKAAEQQVKAQEPPPPEPSFADVAQAPPPSHPPVNEPPVHEQANFPYQLNSMQNLTNTDVPQETSSPYDYLGKPAQHQHIQDGTRDISNAIESNSLVPTIQMGMDSQNNNSQLGYFPNINGRASDPQQGGLKPSRHNFQSMAVNMEYSTISNILTSSNPIGHSSDFASSLSPSVSSAHGEDSPGQHKLDLHHQALHQNRNLHANSLNQFSLESSGGEQAPNFTQVLETVEQINNQQNHEWYESNNPKRPLSFTISTSTELDATSNRNGSISSPSSSHPHHSYRHQHHQQQQQQQTGYPWQYREPADIYATVRQPFSYTPAYHQLTIYIRTRFKREQQIRIAKCMASYRPSFIACTNTLKEDDLIFMEQCFQRTLLEYEKFISYSGTPTLVWRRTGQVAAVGKEFCILTGWSRERLLNEHTFVVELMDDSSALEYFEMFSKMAFGDSRGANMTECTLLTPQGAKIKTSSIWTLKRDVFGIPMMIIGNFLPILP